MSKRSSLSNRLNRLKKDGLSPPVSKELKNSLYKNEVVVNLLPGWERIHPSVWKRSVLKENVLRTNFNDSLLLPDDFQSKDLIFYDTETTGLSTGAGTIPFLIGFGRIKGETLEIVQYFLADYPGEAFMLEALKKDFSQHCYYVSYNGKSYDSHLIDTRFLLNRIECKRRKEVDLLYLSRRLWRNKLENCRLGTIEEKILHICRGPDIPGSEIPDVWFEFLKTGNLEKLKLVFSHNLQDIYSLSILLEKIEKISELLPDSNNYDSFNLGKSLLINQKEKAIYLLKREYNRGNKEGARFLSLFFKREGDWDAAVEIWNKLNRNGFNLFAAVELAKYYEHKKKDPEKARFIIDKFLKGPFKPSGEIREQLLYRKERLLRKIESKNISD